MNSKLAVKQLKALEKNIKGRELRLAAEWDEPWQVLIATILSAMTKDETTIEVSEILFRRWNTPEKLGKARLDSIEKVIRPINYYKTKAKHIKETARIIGDAGGYIPLELDELMKYPGVGRKVGNVYLAEAKKKQVIGVDTHITRIAGKLGWSVSKNPHVIEKDLEKLFPKKYWRSINYIIVNFGRLTKRSEEDAILEPIKNLA